ncbi:Aspartate--tRNA ligase, mitochondrial [Hypsizygus marmoreus]|uniref:Aspartate--tRNA ligase, mitochondrial n=1 Tax=Hypsizygus marmoreus TaxID=39966 RepID=A0A369JS77_HYPMA|nr:Aspartate--tRNA ligase, mitochondrial [Hypsizygus marmoreus]
MRGQARAKGSEGPGEKHRVDMMIKVFRIKERTRFGFAVHEARFGNKGRPDSSYSSLLPFLCQLVPSSHLPAVCCMLPLLRVRPCCTLWRRLSHRPGSLGSSRPYSRPASQDLSDALPPSSSSAHCAPYSSRTHTCGSLTAGDAGARVILTGWLLPERKGKLVSFYPLKDSYGTTQLIVNHSEGATDLSALAKIPVESTVLIEGTVLLRPPNARRPGPTGDIDIQVDKFILLNPAGNLPFVPSNPHNLANDDLRARYRYLDLRRTALSDNLKKRSKVAQIARNVLHDQGFLEVETPVLLRSSPEGAREFLVPTRISKATTTDGETPDKPTFYALQQSPQQPKQLLICSGGVDRYFQVAKCFRDEDGRKDRQPEFTQIDMEMAFVSWGTSEASASADSDIWRIGGAEVRDVVETLIRTIWEKVEGVALPKRFQVMTYNEAMTRFGSDKPDTRFGLEIANITHLLPEEQRSVFENNGEVLECITVRKASEPEFLGASRACDINPADERITITKKNLSTWLCYTTHAALRGTSADALLHINEHLKLMPGDDIWLASRPQRPKGGSTALGGVRLRLFEKAQSRNEFTVTKDPHFLWITEFPLFTQADHDKDFLAKGRWSSSHHPFTAPMWQDIDTMYNGQIEAVRGQHYDLVLNGVEIGGGSVRVHDAAMQDYIFTRVLQLNEEEKSPFHHLLHALQCGAPPHGGLALGFDRIMAMLCNTQSIRDVIAFPKTSTGADLLFKSPAPISNEVLHQYGIKPVSTT